MSTENSRSQATAIDCEVSKSRHNSRTEPYNQKSIFKLLLPGVVATYAADIGSYCL